MSSRGKYAVVTGCNRGVGLGCAQRLVQEGFHVAAVCRRLEDAQITAAKLGASCSFPIQLDFAGGASAVRLAAGQIQEWLGTSKLALLVNNAGNSYGNWDDEAWSESRTVNYEGPVLLTDALLPMIAQNASVIMVGSGLGELGLLSPEFRRLLRGAKTIVDLDKLGNRSLETLNSERSWVAPYGLSKAMVHRATEIFSCDHRFKRKGILVNAVCPGWVCTDMGGAQAPIEVDEAAGHILEKGLMPDPSVTGSFVCYCYKNYDAEHLRAWEAKHGDNRQRKKKMRRA